MSETERIRAGAQAEAELPQLRRACEVVRDGILGAILVTPIEAREARELLYLTARALPELEQLLVQAINDGVLARNSTQLAQHFQTLAQGQRPN